MFVCLRRATSRSGLIIAAVYSPGKIVHSTGQSTLAANSNCPEWVSYYPRAKLSVQIQVQNETLTLDGTLLVVLLLVLRAPWGDGEWGVSPSTGHLGEEGGLQGRDARARLESRRARICRFEFYVRDSCFPIPFIALNYYS